MVVRYRTCFRQGSTVATTRLRLTVADTQGPVQSIQSRGFREIVMSSTNISTVPGHKISTVKKQPKHTPKISQVAMFGVQELERAFPKLLTMPELQFMSTTITQDFADPVKILQRDNLPKKRQSQQTMEKVTKMRDLSLINRATFLRQMRKLSIEEEKHIVNKKILFDMISDYPYYAGPSTIHHTHEPYQPDSSQAQGHFFSLLFPAAQHRRCLGKPHPKLKAEKITQAKKK